MQNTSWRHHYIPQFYLNGFTSKENTFKIYDVDKKRFIKNGKDFYPESYFFEKNSNSVITEEHNSDFIEKAYQTHDTKTSEILTKIANSNSSNHYNINEHDIAALQYFIGLMYWRIPTNQNTLKKRVENNDFEKLGLKLKRNDNEVIDKELEDSLKKNPNFYKFARFMYPSYSYKETFDCDTPIHIISFNKGGPLVCGDNPFVYKNPETFNIHKDDLIFPLNGTRIFIRANTLRKYSQNDFTGMIKIKLDLLIFKQSIRYVSCTDSQYLPELDRFYNKHYGNLSDLRESLMNDIINYNA